jgi:hypothetical protein
MSPHLVTAPVEDRTTPVEQPYQDMDRIHLTTLTPQQARDLLAGHRRSVRLSRTRRWERLLHGRLARCRARQGYWVATVERTGAAVERARTTLVATPAARRPFSRAGAILITAVLMLAGFFTINAILASADLAPLEALLLPIAFGPVFVLATKTTVGAWLASARPNQVPAPAHRVTTWIVGPALACGSLVLVCGVALKSVAVGALVPLPEWASQVSSLLMFAGLALGELTGATALAVRQHRPGARAYAATVDQHRRAVILHELAQVRLRVAVGRADAAESALAVHQEWKAGRARLALASGWARAAGHTSDGDALLARLNVNRESGAGP